MNKWYTYCMLPSTTNNMKHFSRQDNIYFINFINKHAQNI